MRDILTPRLSVGWVGAALVVLALVGRTRLPEAAGEHYETEE